MHAVVSSYYGVISTTTTTQLEYGVRVQYSTVVYSYRYDRLYDGVVGRLVYEARDTTTAENNNKKKKLYSTVSPL